MVHDRSPSFSRPSYNLVHSCQMVSQQWHPLKYKPHRSWHPCSRHPHRYQPNLRNTSLLQQNHHHPRYRKAHRQTQTLPLPWQPHHPFPKYLSTLCRRKSLSKPQPPNKHHPHLIHLQTHRPHDRWLRMQITLRHQRIRPSSLHRTTTRKTTRHQRPLHSQRNTTHITYANSLPSSPQHNHKKNA